MKENGSDGHHDRCSEQKRTSETLMCAQFNSTKSGYQKRRRRERTYREARGHLPQQRGFSNARRRQSKSLNGGGEHWEDAEVKRVRVEEQAQRHGYQAEHDRNVRRESRRNLGD